MRLLIVTVSFMCLSMASAQLLALAGAAKGVAALTAGVTKLAASIIPAGLLLPLAVIGPLKLSLPLILGAKKIGLLKMKLFGLKALPILAPIGIGAGKIAVIKAKVGLAKTAFAAAGKAKLALATLPFKVGAMKIGAFAGAKAGAAAGLASSKTLPKVQFIHPMVIPAAALQSKVTPVKPEYEAPSYSKPSRPAPSYVPEKPAYTTASYTEAPYTTTQAYEVPSYKAPSYQAPEPTYEAPAYTTEAPVYTTEAPVYTTAAPEYTTMAYSPVYTDAPAYRRRRDTSDVSIATVAEAFKLMQETDREQCILRILCEVAVEPQVAGDQAENVIKFMMSLNSDDESAPWTPFVGATITGLETRSRESCYTKYDTCSKSTDDLLRVALGRVHGDEN